MNKIFNRRFWKYFIITFVVVQLLVILSTTNQYLDQFFYHAVPLNFGLKFSLVASTLLLSVSLCSATAIASFITFRHMPQQGVSNFFKMLGIGLGVFLIVAVAIYLYDWNVQPGLKKQSMEMYWKVKNYSTPSSTDSKFNYTPDFENMSPGTLSWEKLHYKSDSLREEQIKHIIECNNLLATLPSTEASEVYEAYKLEHMGVEYQYAETSDNIQDSIIYIQQTLLFDKAHELAESTMLLSEYKLENYKRSMNAVSLLLSYLIFATLGYFLRNRSLTKIFGIIAIIIVSIYLLYGVSHLTERYMKNTLKIKERRY